MAPRLAGELRSEHLKTPSHHFGWARTPLYRRQTAVETELRLKSSLNQLRLNLSHPNEVSIPQFLSLHYPPNPLFIPIPHATLSVMVIANTVPTLSSHYSSHICAHRCCDYEDRSHPLCAYSIPYRRRQLCGTYRTTLTTQANRASQIWI